MSIFDETSYVILLNGSNLDTTDATNSKYRFDFAGTKYFKNVKIALETVNLFYSWFNISAEYGNNSYSFTFTDGVGTTTYNVVMPDGYYSVSNLNTFLQAFCITNGLYLVDNNGDFVYYLELVENPTYYAVQFNAFPFPTALPLGWNNPAGLTFPVVASTPQLIVLNNAFQQTIGFTAGTYPTPIQATTYSRLSDFTPMVSTVESVLLSCNLINNNISNPSNLIYSFSASGVGFGNLIQSSPNQPLFLDVNQGYYSSIELQFLDQSFRPIQLNDTSLIIQLSFKEKKQ